MQIQPQIRVRVYLNLKFVLRRVAERVHTRKHGILRYA